MSACRACIAGDRGDVDASGRPRRIALEAYPGLLAREVLGSASYKSDDKARQTAQRRHDRHDLVAALEQGHTRLGPAAGADAGAA